MFLSVRLNSKETFQCGTPCSSIKDKSTYLLNQYTLSTGFCCFVVSGDFTILGDGFHALPRYMYVGRLIFLLIPFKKKKNYIEFELSLFKTRTTDAQRGYSLPNIQVLCTAEAYFVCHIGPIFQVCLHWVSIVRIQDFKSLLMTKLLGINCHENRNLKKGWHGLGLTQSYFNGQMHVEIFLFQKNSSNESKSKTKMLQIRKGKY